MPNFGWETTGDEVAEAFQGRIKDRIFIITGASVNGIGGQTAISLALGNPKHLVLLGRDQARSQPIMESVLSRSPATEVSFINCDLSSQSSVRRAAESVINLVPHIDILINNAALPPGLYRKTEDGIESQFGTDHIGHFLLTNLLMPKILAAKPKARIVIVASSAYRHAKNASFENYNFSDGKTYSPFEGYIKAKQANVMFSLALARQLERHQVLSYSLHPGGVNTAIQDKVPKELLDRALKQRQEAASNQGQPPARRKSPEQGCSTTLVAALDPSIEDQSGAYLVDGKVSETGLADYVTDVDNGRKMWELSEKLVGQEFDWL